MQARDRGDEAEPQAGAGLASGSSPGARSAAARARDPAARRRARGRRRRSRSLSPTRAMDDGDLGRDAPSAARAASSTEYLMALSTRLATAWLTSSRLTIEAQALRQLTVSSARPRLLGDRLVQLGDVARRSRPRSTRLHALGHRAGLEPRDQQQRVEGLDELVGLLDGLHEAVAVGVGAVGVRAAPPRRGCAGG